MTQPPPPGARTSDYDYALPPELVARYPAPTRDGSRLLVLERQTGNVRHRAFPDLLDLLRPGDLLVANESRVDPVRLVGTRPSGAPAEALLLGPWEGGADRFRALVRPAAKLAPPRSFHVAPDLEVRVEAVLDDGVRGVRLVSDRDPAEALARHGRVPLPPYLDREAEPEDRERYQTVYARVPGSVAAPTAGFHFTPELLDAAASAGVEFAAVVLHVGVGTFRPVDHEDPGAHPMHEEAWSVSPETAQAVERTRARNGRVWAVGTTTVRVLESAADGAGGVRAGQGTTDLFIRPPYTFQVVDGLVTNFHLPRSTLMMLVAAFAGYESTMAAYAEATRERYRFYSYGDAMVIV